METEAPLSPPASKRPRSWLLVVLGIGLAVMLVMWMSDSTAPTTPTSNPPRPQQSQAGSRNGPVDPASLDVRLEALESPRADPDDTQRNPFRFAPKPPPPRDPAFDNLPQRGAPPPVVVSPDPVVPPGPPPVPPIPLKYMGLIEDPSQQLKLASFTDCRLIYRAREGEEFGGQYRLVSIGIESAVVEYVNGKGRTTLRMSGEGCTGK